MSIIVWSTDILVIALGLTRAWWFKHFFDFIETCSCKHYVLYMKACVKIKQNIKQQPYGLLRHCRPA